MSAVAARNAPPPRPAALPKGVLGLRTWIWRNNARSLLMLVGFPVLVALIVWALALAWLAIVDEHPLAVAPGEAAVLVLPILPIVFAVIGVWFLIAVAIQKRAILALASAQIEEMTPRARRIRRLLEPLAISRGLPVPQTAIIPSPGLNAFATGWSEKDAVIGVTEGLLDTLDDDELEAVLAHELTHIINRDTRLLIISIVFVGVFALASELTMRLLRGGARISTSGSGRGGSWGSSGSSSGGSRKGGQIVLFIIATIIVLWIGRIGAMFLRFAISRKREYMADAGAIELTKNGEALVRALTKIQVRPEVAGVSDEVQQMFIFDPPDVWELFSTHPEMEDRIAAIRAIG